MRALGKNYWVLSCDAPFTSEDPSHEHGGTSQQPLEALPLPPPHPPAQRRTLRLKVPLSIKAAEWKIEALGTKGDLFVRLSACLSSQQSGIELLLFARH